MNLKILKILRRRVAEKIDQAAQQDYWDGESIFDDEDPDWKPVKTHYLKIAEQIIKMVKNNEI